MSQVAAFFQEVAGNIEALQADTDLQALSRIWVREITRHKYAYNFTWMGRPIIQFPQDMVAMQEIMWKIRPDVVIEAGVAHGGSILYYASLLELFGSPEACVIGVDIEIRAHNRTEIENHPMAHRVKLIEGSSIAPKTLEAVYQALPKPPEEVKALVILDSNHTHAHVLEELRLYSPLVKADSYLVVFDTIIEDMPQDMIQSWNRPWQKGDNPKTAVHAFLAENDRFAIDKALESKLLITVAPDGYLKCLK